MDAENNCKHLEKANISFTHSVNQDLLTLREASVDLEDIDDVVGEWWQKAWNPVDYKAHSKK